MDARTLIARDDFESSNGLLKKDHFRLLKKIQRRVLVSGLVF
jgi:hypothetical protein